MTNVIALISGLLFGLGLILSEMVNPARVQGFLDWFGHWDPTLGFVMAGALSVTIPGFYFLKQRSKPVLSAQFQWPQKTDIDKRLILGAAMFGCGWGLAGFCPGPALTAIVSFLPQVLTFNAAMLAGMWLFLIWNKRSQ
ncbi:YeeE/YedE family protein [Colwellia sp. C1TZA3]|uniref:YeeE/YedE family protein n=1 Tax=Colwellia sp. C1TZA3 TaxID=2508879 RepID=UPI0011B95A02|nr:YeeE/YedE family protein [Colwellia sp. C1TZA3]TWX70012.1 YeeE/YedE family protein [Colwellia sp. C1TZA3]